MTTIGYIIGSISSTSINRQLVEAMVKLAPEGVEFKEIEIKQLPFYSPDLEAEFPQIAKDFKQEIVDVDGVLIATPEYSRSIPGVLKNAFDWSTRPYGDMSFNGKPVAIIGASQGPISTAAAQQHLRAIMGHFNAIVMGQPEGMIQVAPGLLENGEITNEGTAEFLGMYLQSFASLIERVQKANA
ncbi:NADPH-dependent FMN reductase [Gulosibacter molinativorax]|uniref:NAD(P)H-dependent oxidoreductase n=1 Tax=Gulosibacter molinativorax TaxID=256821 RepID=A0ABT7C9G4_9MICO|nr:NADPH-dependent FMN reductase [Gulosibacter molinativorax]MDJ1371859.1 NAD(P)H-dependent oxidoreductase [Gulosibacter molinativorax]QUY62508.1 NADPH azoreductase [Gulosibacter molinativorax]